jgi:alkanesulfonate monooxygenase SsuD/methylene tetrahydromethanopterin reductase-like flavin-dependent oxidoreductase (luciferase family)
MPRRLKIGIQLPEIEYEPRWADIRAIAQVAEDIGLDSVWVGDHHLHRTGGRTRGPWEAWSQLAAIAAVTERVEIGPLVASVSFHPPVVIARMAATIDEISGGRFILGLGAGWSEAEYLALGLPFDHLVARFEEAFTIIRTLLRDGAIDFDGRYHVARDAELLPRATRPGGPPLLIGSSGPRMLRATMLHVDAWNAWYTTYGNRPSGVAEQRAIVDEACREVGRDPAEIVRTVAVFVRMPGATGARDFDRFAAPPLEGPPDPIAATLADFAREGIGHVQLVVDPITPAGVESLAPVLEALDQLG